MQKLFVPYAVLTLFYRVKSSVASPVGLVRGTTVRNLESCGSFGVCNTRYVCTTVSGCMCKDGFTDPPYCRDLDECRELDPPPCHFDGADCIDLDPHLDASPGGKYKCAC